MLELPSVADPTPVETRFPPDPPLYGPDDVLAGRAAAMAVRMAPSIKGYIVDIVRATRDAPSVQVGASPRGTLAIMKLARARAVLDGRDFVVPDDVKAVAAPALAHRLSLRPELWVQQVRAEDVVAERLATVPTPPAEEP